MGELGLFYRCFPIVLIGKGFPPGGGQNPWEPARLGCAVASGPDTRNFADAVALLRQAGALQVVQTGDQLTEWVDRMLSDDGAREAMGLAGQAAAGAGSDLPARLAERLVALMPKP